MAPETRTDPVQGSAVYPLGSRVNERGHLEIGGCDVADLAGEFGTPAYVYAEDDLRARARGYLDAFRAHGDDFEVIYASKAAPVSAIYRLFAEEGLAIDVASGGELHMAVRAGCEPARIHLHGNNKTRAELELAIEVGVGHVIVHAQRAEDEFRPADVGTHVDHEIEIDPLGRRNAAEVEHRLSGSVGRGSRQLRWSRFRSADRHFAGGEPD